MSACVCKRVPHEFAEGQKIEQRAVNALRPAFARAVRHVRDEVDRIIEDHADDRTWNVAIAFNSLPWHLFSQELVEAWRPIAEKVITESAVKAAADNPRVLKAGPVPGELRAIAERWASEHALLMAETTTLGSELGVRAMLVKAINLNAAPLDVAKAIRGSVGITTADVEALDRLRIKLEKKFSPSRVRQKLTTKSNQMRRRRAENIARTEINGARNRGTLEVWRNSQGLGELPGTTAKMWVASGGCRVCETIVANGPVPLNEPFQTLLGPAMHPPAHPSCRCSMALTFVEVE